MFGSFGWMELLLILIIVLIIFGAGKLPQLGEGLGKAIKGFKKSVQEADVVEEPPMQQSMEQPIEAAHLAEGAGPASVRPPTAEVGEPAKAGSGQDPTRHGQAVPSPSHRGLH